MSAANGPKHCGKSQPEVDTNTLVRCDWPQWSVGPSYRLAPLRYLGHAQQFGRRLMQPPLAGIEIIELATMIAVPAATHLLVTQGASVIKVENTGTGDELRRYGSQKNGMSGWFATSNAGKRSIALDLTTEDAKAALWKLLDRADVFVCGFRPGVVERLGFTWEEASQRNPRLIWVSSTGFGPNGPYANRPVYDPVIQALAGTAGSQQSNGDPTLVAAMIADKVAALTTAQAITAALAGRGAHDGGRKIELSMLESNLAFNWPDQMMHTTLLDDDASHFPNVLAYYRLFRCLDGWVAAATGTDTQWASFCNALDRPDMAVDDRFATAPARGSDFEGWYDMIDELLSAFPVDQAVERLVAADVPAMRVHAAHEIADNEQVRASGSIAEVDHPVAGRIRMPQQAARFVDVRTLAAAPMQGEHTDQILAELN